MAQITWNPVGGSQDGSVDANWVGGVAPTVNDAPVFDGAVSNSSCVLSLPSYAYIYTQNDYGGTIQSSSSMSFTEPAAVNSLLAGTIMVQAGKTWSFAGRVTLGQTGLSGTTLTVKLGAPNSSLSFSSVPVIGNFQCSYSS